MGIIAWIILGLIAGAIAKLIYPGRQGGGIFATMFLGIVGAFIGGTLHTWLTTGAFQLAGVSFSFGGIGLAIVGAIILIFIWGLVTRRGASNT
ncbi:MAG: GlsB/YeaQ/YmgE family stress response membrane protein [Thainema sp.]